MSVDLLKILLTEPPMAENPNSAMFRTVVLDKHPFEKILTEHVGTDC